MAVEHAVYSVRAHYASRATLPTGAAGYWEALAAALSAPHAHSTTTLLGVAEAMRLMAPAMFQAPARVHQCARPAHLGSLDRALRCVLGSDWAADRPPGDRLLVMDACAGVLYLAQQDNALGAQAWAATLLQSANSAFVAALVSGEFPAAVVVTDTSWVLPLLRTMAARWQATDPYGACNAALRRPLVQWQASNCDALVSTSVGALFLYTSPSLWEDTVAYQALVRAKSSRLGRVLARFPEIRDRVVPALAADLGRSSLLDSSGGDGTFLPHFVALVRPCLAHVLDTLDVCFETGVLERTLVLMRGLLTRQVGGGSPTEETEGWLAPHAARVAATVRFLLKHRPGDCGIVKLIAGCAAALAQWPAGVHAAVATRLTLQVLAVGQRPWCECQRNPCRTFPVVYTHVVDHVDRVGARGLLAQATTGPAMLQVIRAARCMPASATLQEVVAGWRGRHDLHPYLAAELPGWRSVDARLAWARFRRWSPPRAAWCAAVVANR